MSDKKISQLTSSTTPLAGTEVLPVVQGGVTKQVSVNNLTDGKVVPTIGVKFPATQSASTDVNTLDDYREGTFTATGTGFSDATPPSGTARYVKVGNMVMISLPQISGTSNATTFTVTGMPSVIYPTLEKATEVQVRDANGAFVMGRCYITSAGLIVLYKNIDAGTWTASGSKMLNPCMISYII